jgi:hypothetical protein
MFSTSIIEALIDVTAHSEHKVLFRSDIGAKAVERSGIKYTKWYKMNIIY